MDKPILKIDIFLTDELKMRRISSLKLGNFQFHRLTLNKDDDDFEQFGDLLVEEARPKLKRPSLYKVVMFNDDYTPMEFVVHILESFFGMDREKATRVMLQVHTEGKAVCGIYTRDIAETKAAQVTQYSQEHEHPLLCEIEVVEDDE